MKRGGIGSCHLGRRELEHEIHKALAEVAHYGRATRLTRVVLNERAQLVEHNAVVRIAPWLVAHADEAVVDERQEDAGSAP